MGGIVARLKQLLAGRWGLMLRVAVSAILLGYIFHRFQWSDLWDHLRTASPAWLLIAWLFFGIPLLLIGIRWWLLLRVQDVQLRLRKVLAITCIGQFFNAFLLGATGGDLVKILYVIREAPQAKARAGLSILVDRAMGLVALAVVALAAASTDWALFTSRSDLRRVVWVLCGIVAASAAALIVVLAAPLPRFRDRLVLVNQLQEAARQYVKAFRLTASAAVISVLVHLSSFTGGYSIARALHLDIGYVPVAVILAMVFFVISVPVSISGHGLRESIFALMFSLFGIGASAAIACSLLYFGLNLAWSLAGGLIYLASGSVPRPAASAREAAS